VTASLIESALIEEFGYAVARQVFTSAQLTSLAEILSRLMESNSSRNSRVKDYAMRNLLKISPPVCEFANNHPLISIARGILGENAQAVKATLFDKTAQANWKVPWHQDLTVAVDRRIEAAGFGPWTVKGGVHHVQPPISVLEGIVALRVHLDDALADSGALRVLPRTHRLGRLSAEKLMRISEEVEPVIVEARRGDVMVMKPLLVHASSACASPDHRRVLHIEYAAEQLPYGLSWIKACGQIQDGTVPTWI
jgi:hypothetical protein